jgi:hypothetical protein
MWEGVVVVENENIWEENESGESVNSEEVSECMNNKVVSENDKSDEVVIE